MQIGLILVGAEDRVYDGENVWEEEEEEEKEEEFICSCGWFGEESSACREFVCKL